MCVRFNRTLNDRSMEKKIVTVKLTVLTQRSTARDIEQDMDHLVLPLRKLESGQTAVCDVEITKVE